MQNESPTKESATTTQTAPEPANKNGHSSERGTLDEHLGNILIGTALVMALLLGLTVRYLVTSGDEEPEPIGRDAEIEFVSDRDRDRDEEREFAESTYFDDAPEEIVEVDCDFDDRDGDAESRFAEDPACETRTVRTGLFGDTNTDNDIDETINFRRLERPTLRHDLSDRGSSRVLELSVWLGDGRDDIDLAIDSSERVSLNGNGAAIRTTNDAVLLSDSRFVSIRRPDDCRRGCSVTLWVTLGPWFQELHPDADLVVYAGDNADASVELLTRLPREAYR